MTNLRTIDKQFTRRMRERFSAAKAMHISQWFTMPSTEGEVSPIN